MHYEIYVFCDDFVDSVAQGNGSKFWKFLRCFHFGNNRAMLIVLKYLNMELLALDSSITPSKSHPTISQHTWKKRFINPSRPSAFPGGREKTTFLSSWIVNGAISLMFSNFVTINGISARTSSSWGSKWGGGC